MHRSTKTPHLDALLAYDDEPPPQTKLSGDIVAQLLERFGSKLSGKDRADFEHMLSQASGEDMGLDDDDEAEEVIKTKLLALLQSRDPDALAKIKKLLTGGAMDDPPDFPGKPRPGGSMTAIDAMPPALRHRAVDFISSTRAKDEADFALAFPNAARIRTGWPV